MKSPFNRRAADAALHLAHRALQPLALPPREFSAVTRAANEPDWNFRLITAFLRVARVVDRGETGALPALEFPLNAKCLRAKNRFRAPHAIFSWNREYTTRTLGSGKRLSPLLTLTFRCLPPRNGAYRKHFVRLIVHRTRHFRHRCRSCAYRTYRDTHIVRGTSLYQQPVSAGPWTFANRDNDDGGDRDVDDADAHKRYLNLRAALHNIVSGTATLDADLHWIGRFTRCTAPRLVHLATRDSPRKQPNLTILLTTQLVRYSTAEKKSKRETRGTFPPHVGLSRGVLATREGKMPRKRRRGRNGLLREG